MSPTYTPSEVAAMTEVVYASRDTGLSFTNIARLLRLAITDDDKYNHKFGLARIIYNAMEAVDNE